MKLKALLIGCLLAVSIPKAMAHNLPSHVGLPAPAMVEESIGTTTYEVGRIEIKARPQQVWQVLTDYNNAPKIFPCLEKSSVLQSNGSVKLVSQTIKPSGIPTTFNYTLELKETAPDLLEFRRVSGAFKDNRGWWKLQPIAGGEKTLVTFAKHLDAGFFIPQMIVIHQLKIDMPAVLLALKAEAEQLGDIAHQTL